jgi:hypothetical protein
LTFITINTGGQISVTIPGGDSTFKGTGDRPSGITHAGVIQLTVAETEIIAGRWGLEKGVVSWDTASNSILGFAIHCFFLVLRDAGPSAIAFTAWSNTIWY